LEFALSTSLVYNIPARRIDAYPGRNLIVRSELPDELADCLRRADKAAIRFVQLLSVANDSSVLEGTGEAIPLEIFLSDPSQYHRLYDFGSLLDSHPVRIAIPVIPGFSKAVKLAVSLNYAVKLEVEQPNELLIEELESVLDLYLHRSYVRQPIEPFQSTLLSLFRDEVVSFWGIAEEDPQQVRYITDDGQETISKRFVHVKLDFPLGDFVVGFGEELIAERGECSGCEFFNRCGGYFKWPNRAYRCDGIRRVLQTLATTTREVRQDLDSYQVMGART